MKALRFENFDYRRHLEVLYGMMMQPEEQSLFMAHEVCSSLQEFEGWLSDRLRGFYHDFFLLTSERSRDDILGFVYAYHMRPGDGNCKMGVYVRRDCRNGGLGALATLQFLNYLFRFYPLRKVYTEVYGYNHDSLTGNLEAGFVEEGVLREYIYFAGSYHDYHILAISRETFQARWQPLFDSGRIGEAP